MDNTHWLLIGFAALLLIVFVAKRLRQVPATKAREMLASGALVVDVRSSDEFASGHLEGAVNLPVEQIRRRITDIESDHSRPLLVYCVSGTRSGIACRILRGLGYREAFNLGSLGRARSVARN